MLRKQCGLAVIQNIFAYIPHCVVYIQYLVMHSAALLGAPALAAAYAPPARAIKGGVRAGIPSHTITITRGVGRGSGKTGGARAITYRLYTDPCIAPTKRGGSRKMDTPICEMAIENLENLC